MEKNSRNWLAWGRTGRIGSAVLALMMALTLVGGTAEAKRGDYTFYKDDTVQVRQTDGAGLRVRQAPGLAETPLTTLAENATVRVVAGPVWSDGYGWYKVTGFDSSGTEGWSAGWWLFKVVEQKKAAVTAAPARSADTETASTTTSSTSSYTPPAPRPAGPVYSVLATGYNGAEFNSTGYMANGNRVHWGAVAVDPRYIPLGTRMYISGFGSQVFVAEDTGSAIKGWRIDIWFPTLNQAIQFGGQQRTVTIIR